MQEISQVTPPPTQSIAPLTSPSELPKKPTVTEIQTWQINYLADVLEIDADEIDITVPFDRYGLDSSVAVGMSGDLEDWLGYEFDPTLLYDYPTIEALAKHIAAELQTE